METCFLEIAGVGVQLNLHGSQPASPGDLYRETAPADPALIADVHLTRALDASLLTLGVPPRHRFTPDGRILVDGPVVYGDLHLPRDHQAPVHATLHTGNDCFSLNSALRLAVGLTLPRRRALLLHASSVALPAGDAAFAAVSGTGKSTLANLLSAPPHCLHKLTDDAVLLRWHDDAVWTHAPPFLGAGCLTAPDRTAPLTAIYLLSQAPRHRKSPVPLAQALPGLARHTAMMSGPRVVVDAFLDTLELILRTVPCWRLEFAPDPDVFEILSEATPPCSKGPISSSNTRTDWLAQDPAKPPLP
jgi:hypothetical protein